MASASRAKQFTDLHKTLKKHYKPVRSQPERPVLDQLLLACCLEDAHYEAAEEALAALVHTFFDWNEVRVTTIRELTELMGGLPDPRAAANRVKRVLQSVFEESFSFELEECRKKNLGPTVKWLAKIDGSTNFMVAYVVQSALGGHSIPIDSGTMAVLRLLDLATEEDAQTGTVPGLERAISKAKGVDFGSLLHQLGADFTANPFAPRVRDILVEIDPTVADRLPKRREAKPTKRTDARVTKAQSREGSEESEKESVETTVPSTKKSVTPAKRPKATAKKKSAPPEEAESASPSRRKSTKKKVATQRLAKKKPR